jgi:profilin
MSWQAYVDNQLLATGKIAQAAIYGHNGSLWATSPGFQVKYSFFRVSDFDAKKKFIQVK